MLQEVKMHEDRKHWEVVPIASLKPEVKLLESVWAVQQKWCINTCEIYKYKACLNAHGGQQEYGIHYWEMHSPVLTWVAIRLILVLVMVYQWNTLIVNFVLAYPQAPIEGNLYMKLPQGVTYGKGISRSTHALHLSKNIYGLKQVGQVWNWRTNAVTIQSIWLRSFYITTVMSQWVFMLMTAWSSPPWKPKPSRCIRPQSRVWSDQQEANRWLSESEHHQKHRWFVIQDPATSDTTDSQWVGLQRTNKRPEHPGSVKQHTELQRQWQDKEHKVGLSTNIGQVKFSWEKHKTWHCLCCASNEPDSPLTLKNILAIMQISRYPSETKECGLLFTRDSQLFDRWCNTDFSGNWDAATAHRDPPTAKSWTGFVIMFAGSPIAWTSRLQTKVALSMTKAGFIALSKGMWLVIPLMHLLKKFPSRSIDMALCKPAVHCQVFENNDGVLELAKVQQFQPRTKHINIKYWHFREYVENKMVNILPIDTKDQLVDIFTKPLASKDFSRLRDRLIGSFALQCSLSLKTNEWVWYISNLWAGILYVSSFTFDSHNITHHYILITQSNLHYHFHSAIYIIIFTEPLTKTLHNHC